LAFAGDAAIAALNPASAQQQTSSRAGSRDPHLCGFDIRPLPPHFLHGGGYILRPGWTGCLAAWYPVPSQAKHLCSFGFAGGFFIRSFHAGA
jgi:hypothetical protein